MHNPAPLVPLNERLRAARTEAKYKSAAAAARAMGYKLSTYRSYENGTRLYALEDAMKFAAAYGVDLTRIWDDPVPLSPYAATKLPHILPNVRMTTQPLPAGSTIINRRGRDAGGMDGQMLMTKEAVGTVVAPPDLSDVPDAYACYIVGDSMEPRYHAGETVFVHPYKPHRRGDDVLVQIKNADHPGEPYGYVKEFISQTRTTVTVCQHNPKKELEFPREDVIAIHRVVGASYD